MAIAMKGQPDALPRGRETDVVRNKRLGYGQTKLLQLGQDGPIDRTTLNGGEKQALYGLKRIGLVDEQDRTTEAGRTALATGTYPVTLDHVERTFERNLKILRRHWRMYRYQVIHRAVADAVKRLREAGIDTGEEGPTDER